jgi:hypothetical protein
MYHRIPTFILLLLGLSAVGCDKPTRGELSAASSQKKSQDPEKTDTKTEQDRDKSLAAEKAASAKNFPNKYRCKWSDAKESDFPLVIQLEVPTTPEEIKGPFPENSEWPAKEKTPAMKPDKKSGKGHWPWN